MGDLPFRVILPETCLTENTLSIAFVASEVLDQVGCVFVGADGGMTEEDGTNMSKTQNTL